MRVLVVEDKLKMAGLIRRGLVEDGHGADIAATGEDALWMAEAHPYDAIVLDVMLPGLSGFETCRRLRNAGVWSPVLMLTSRDSVEDRVSGLDAGDSLGGRLCQLNARASRWHRLTLPARLRALQRILSKVFADVLDRAYSCHRNDAGIDRF